MIQSDVPSEVLIPEEIGSGKVDGRIEIGTVSWQRFGGRREGESALVLIDPKVTVDGLRGRADGRADRVRRTAPLSLGPVGRNRTGQRRGCRVRDPPTPPVGWPPPIPSPGGPLTTTGRRLDAVRLNWRDRTRNVTQWRQWRSGTKLRRTAAQVFGWKSLRPGQLTAMRSVMAGRDTLVVMPTGAGKSAIYQVPALLLDGPTVVVSPLIALQRDQVAGLLRTESTSAVAVAVNSSQRGSESVAALEAVAAGRPSSSSSRRSSSATPTCWRRSRPPSRRCSWSTRRTASRRGATISAPTTSVWAT